MRFTRPLFAHKTNPRVRWYTPARRQKRHFSKGALIRAARVLFYTSIKQLKSTLIVYSWLGPRLRMPKMFIGLAACKNSRHCCQKTGRDGSGLSRNVAAVESKQATGKLSIRPKIKKIEDITKSGFKKKK